MRYLFLCLGLAACGGKNYCERSAAAAEDCGEEFSDADLQACEDALADCSGDDEKLLDEMYDCFEDAGLLECDSADTLTGETDDFLAAFACIGPLAELSETCANSMGMGVSFTTGSTSSTSSTTTQ